MELSQFTFYYLVAVLVQIILLILVRKERIETPRLSLLIVLFMALNATTLSGLITPLDNEIVLETLLRLFYAVIFLQSATFLSYAIQISMLKTGRITRQIENGVWIAALCGALFSLLTDEIIMGYHSFSIIITAIKGDNYWISVIQGQMAVLTAVAVLVRAWTKLPESTQKKRCLVILISYASHALHSLVIVALMRYGVEINFAITFPFLSTLSTLLIVYGEVKYRYNPVKKPTAEKQEMSDRDKLNNIFTKYEKGEYSFIQAMDKIDLLLLMHAYNKHDGNMMRAAKAMGLGRSTLYKKARRHNLR